MGPNEQDPPAGNEAIEAFYDNLYEKFPWVEDLIHSSPEAWPVITIQENIEAMITWVMDAAHRQGMSDAKADTYEYIGHLESQVALLGKSMRQ